MNITWSYYHPDFNPETDGQAIEPYYDDPADDPESDVFDKERHLAESYEHMAWSQVWAEDERPALEEALK